MESKKTYIMVAVTVICLIVAGWISYATIFKSNTTKGWQTLESGVMYWMMCRSCNNKFQIERKEYFAYLQKQDPTMMNVAPMECPKCGKKAAHHAYECQKCKHCFYEGAAGRGNFEDTCPKCGFSQEGENRKMQQ